MGYTLEFCKYMKYNFYRVFIKVSWVVGQNAAVVVVFFTSTTKLALESVWTEALVIPDCEDSVLIQEALELVLLMLAEFTPRLSRSEVLRCLRILCNTPLISTFIYIFQ